MDSVHRKLLGETLREIVCWFLFLCPSTWFFNSHPAQMNRFLDTLGFIGCPRNIGSPFSSRSQESLWYTLVSESNEKHYGKRKEVSNAVFNCSLFRDLHRNDFAWPPRF